MGNAALKPRPHFSLLTFSPNYKYIDAIDGAMLTLAVVLILLLPLALAAVMPLALEEEAMLPKVTRSRDPDLGRLYQVEREAAKGAWVLLDPVYSREIEAEVDARVMMRRGGLKHRVVVYDRNGVVEVS